MDEAEPPSRAATTGQRFPRGMDDWTKAFSVWSMMTMDLPCLRYKNQFRNRFMIDGRIAVVDKGYWSGEVWDLAYLM